jgi:hypothetical protein
MIAPDQTPALMALAHHQDRAVRSAVLNALYRFQPRPAWIADALDGLLTTGCPNDVATWLCAIAMEPPRCASRLQELIARTDLIARTHDPENAWAGRAISHAAPLDAAQIAMLRPLLSDEDPARHLSAACALAEVLTVEEQKIATTRALAALETPEWRLASAETLVALHADPQAATIIRPYFDRGDRHLPDAAGVDLLITLLDDPEPNLVQRVCELLAKHGQEGRRALPRLRSLAWAPEGLHAQEAWCVIAALDADDHEAIGRTAAQAWRGYRERRLVAIAALTAHPMTIPSLLRLSELLSSDPDARIAAAGKRLAARHPVPTADP